MRWNGSSNSWSVADVASNGRESITCKLLGHPSRTPSSRSCANSVQGIDLRATSVGHPLLKLHHSPGHSTWPREERNTRGRCGTRTIDSRIEGQGHPPGNGQGARRQSQRSPEEGRDHRQDPRHHRLRPVRRPLRERRRRAHRHRAPGRQWRRITRRIVAADRRAGWRRAGWRRARWRSRRGPRPTARRRRRSPTPAPSPIAPAHRARSVGDRSVDVEHARPHGAGALGADGEPLADWEIALLEQGDAAADDG